MTTYTVYVAAAPRSMPGESDLDSVLERIAEVYPRGGPAIAASASGWVSLQVTVDGGEWAPDVADEVSEAFCMALGIATPIDVRVRREDLEGE